MRTTKYHLFPYRTHVIFSKACNYILYIKKYTTPFWNQALCSRVWQKSFNSIPVFEISTILSNKMIFFLKYIDFTTIKAEKIIKVATL